MLCFFLCVQCNNLILFFLKAEFDLWSLTEQDLFLKVQKKIIWDTVGVLNNGSGANHFLEVILRACPYWQLAGCYPLGMSEWTKYELSLFLLSQICINLRWSLAPPHLLSRYSLGDF